MNYVTIINNLSICLSICLSVCLSIYSVCILYLLPDAWTNPPEIFRGCSRATGTAKEECGCARAWAH